MISEHASPLALVGGVDAGGQNVYVAQLARALAAAGHQVDVLTRRDAPQQPPAVPLQRGVRVLHVAAGPACFVPKEELLPYMPQFADAAQRLLAAGSGCDVLHANFFMSGSVGLTLRQRLGVPLVTTFHAFGQVRREHPGEADRFPPPRIDIERRLAQESDRVVATCPQDQADLRRLYGADPERIVRVPCGVDTHALRPGNRGAARRRLGLPGDEFIVLQIGRIEPHKGIDNVLRALALWPALPEAPRVRLLVGGGGADAPDTGDERIPAEIDRLRRLAQSLGVTERVHFLGWRPPQQLRDLYLAADVLVATPWHESLGITPLEAMACGTPVIGSAVGGIKHAVLPGVTGFLVPPHDPPALVRRLAELQHQPALAAAMGRAGVQRVRTLFTWELVARQLAEVYASLVPERPRPHPLQQVPPVQALAPRPARVRLAGVRVAP